MESILLGALAVAGYNSSKAGYNSSKAGYNSSKAGYNSSKKDNKRRKNYNPKELDSTYNSNMENNMNQLQKTQADNLVKSIKKKKPDYFSQFDELTFDNISLPVPLSDAYATMSGNNPNLQKNLDSIYGYSSIDEDLDYNVITKENFTHNNMTPNSSKRDYTPDDARASRKLESFTGVSDFYTPKQEKYPLFEPMKNLTYVNGMPVFTDYVDDRYLPSNKNNMGNLPFVNNVKVKPGIQNENRHGLGTVYRILPRTTNALRGEHNQKISYKNKPLETAKKGDFRGPDFNITKYKLPDYREQSFDDLVPGRSVIEAQKKTGKYTNVYSQRGEEETYYSGHATNSNMGDGPATAKTSFEPSRKQELYNDPTHNFHGVDIKPVFLNVESYPNRDNQRTNTNASQNGTAYQPEAGLYYNDKNYIPLPTIRNETSHGLVLGAQGEYPSGNVQYNDKAKTTIREGTTHDLVLGSHPENPGAANYYTDKAKKTIKETTSHGIILGSQPENPGVANYYTDEAKKTIKETTSHGIILGSQPENPGVATYYTDTAKKTIKETTSHGIILGSQPENPGAATYYNDTAKKTIKETTSHGNILGSSGVENFSGIIQPTDKAKITIRQTSLYTTPAINIASDITAGYTKDDTDIARRTIRETTEDTKNEEAGIHGVETYQGYTKDYKDIAKPTINQTTISQTPGINFVGEVPTGWVKNDEDIAKATHRQTTEKTIYEGPLGGTENGYTRDVRDKAKTTIRQTTMLTDYKGIATNEVNRPTSHVDAENMTIRETREISTYNRPANGGKNITGPQLNKKTVKMNCRKESIYYVPHPVRALDNNIMPSNAEPYHKHTFENKKPQLDYGNYYTNNIYINTLNDNPLVNDIYHQKNIQYDQYLISK